uniref:RuBisCO large subunit-binding protein subunit beta, chloroplastic n=1 Tax=Tanacetum cinerariifolium TaxID=118510 RepID=A0A699HRF5_TANCI|nr:RuBisCO large subunit-binding protein subunit beta, chloroplastic [Tanacetum cinerariifolium]
MTKEQKSKVPLTALKMENLSELMFLVMVAKAFKIRASLVMHIARMLAPIYVILAPYRMKLPQLMPSRIRLQGTLTRYEVRLTLENAWSKVLGFAAKVVLIKDVTIIVADESTHESISK